jgi:hypothetical protein
VTLVDLIHRLEAIDYGVLDTLDDACFDATLAELEDIVDTLGEHGIDVHEGDLAIRYFMTDLEKSRAYLYGPTDTGNGVGLIEKVRALL